MSQIILFIFAGREANLEVQRPFLDRLLQAHPQVELHLWDMTRNADDAAYLKTRDGAHDGRVQVLTHLHSGHPIRCLYPNGASRRRGSPPCRCIQHKPPYEEPYKFYAGRSEFENATFVKIDDDVLFLETDTFPEFIGAVEMNPDQVFSANVANNVVCAKYDPEVSEMFEPACGDPDDPENDVDWWALHTSRHFARICHDHFLVSWGTPYFNARPFKTRKGEAISINCIAFKHGVMKELAEGFRTNARLGDEGAVDAMLPWIVPTFRAAHLTFGTQEAVMSDMELQSYRDRYAAVAKEYLS